MGIKAWWNRVFNPPEPLTVYTVDTQSTHPRGDNHPFEKYKVRSLMAHGVRMEGHLTSNEGLVIDGHLKGSITMTGEGTALVVREGGCIEGPVSGPMVVIRGTVIGDVHAHFVRLYPGARVEGAVAATRLIIDDGAEVNSARVGAGQWVGPALEHLPAVAPTPTTALPSPVTEPSAQHAETETARTHDTSPSPPLSEHPLGWQAVPLKESVARLTPHTPVRGRKKTATAKVGQRRASATKAKARASPPAQWRLPSVDPPLPPSSLPGSVLESHWTPHWTPVRSSHNGAALNGQAAPA